MALCSQLPVGSILILASAAYLASLICYVQGSPVYFSKIVTPDTGVLVDNNDGNNSISSSTSSRGISSTPDDDCTTNFATLEKALIETKDNKHKLIQAFYPNEKYDTIYVKDVEYHFLGKDENDSEIVSKPWIWAESAFYLIQPPSVFQYTSLFFAYSVDEVDNSPLSLYLPYQCRLTNLNLTALNNTCHQGNNGINPMLASLTQRLNYYAKFNDVGRVVVEDESNKVAVCDSELEGENYNSKPHLTTFFAMTFGLPISLICLLAVVVKSLQSPIRRSIRKKSNHSNIAALALTGLYISAFILVLDVFAVELVYRGNHELSNHSATGQYYYPLIFVFVLLAVDGVSFCITIFVYFNIICCTGEKCISCVFACMYFPVFGLIRTKDKGNIASSGEPTAATTAGNSKLEMLPEYKLWLVLCGFIAPFVCLLSHIGFIVVAWVSDPEHAWSSALRTLFSFLFFFFLFRQSYERFNKLRCECRHILACICCPCCWVYVCFRNENSCCPDPKQGDMLELLEPLEIGDENTKDDKIETGSIDFDFRAFFMSGVLGLFIAGIQALIIFSFIELPFSTDTAPSYILNIMQLAFLVLAVFIAYKVIVLHKPIEKSILEKITDISEYLKTSHK